MINLIRKTHYQKGYSGTQPGLNSKFCVNSPYSAENGPILCEVAAALPADALLAI